MHAPKTALLLLIAAAAYGQVHPALSDSAQLSGTIVDTSNAAIAGATVVMKNA